MDALFCYCLFGHLWMMLSTSLNESQLCFTGRRRRKKMLVLFLLTVLLKSLSCLWWVCWFVYCFFFFFGDLLDFTPPIDLSHILRSGTKNGISIETGNVFIVQWEKKNKLLGLSISCFCHTSLIFLVFQ